jgi:phosphatidylinositol alpha-1,6-mannosyltransferase
VKIILVWHLNLLKYLFLLRSSGARTILFLHGIEAWRHQGPATQLLLRRVDRILCNSQYSWDRFIAHNPQMRARPHDTVALGIGDAAGAEAPVPERRPIAVMIGRLVRAEDYKGHREVIGAWPLVARCLPDAELWIIGDGDLRAALETLVRARGLAGSVRFLGALPDAQRDRALAGARCLLMPSRGEGFGLVYLEAMRVSRPCLVSTFDAGREVVNPPEAGLAVDPADPPQLAGAIVRLLSPGPEWDAWSRQARRRYEQRFTADCFERRIVAALSGIVAANGSST